MKIGCSLPTLYDLIQGGKLRSYHIGRAHRVSEQAVADCIALLERESTQERTARRTPPWGSGMEHAQRERRPALGCQALDRRSQEPCAFVRECLLLGRIICPYDSQVVQIPHCFDSHDSRMPAGIDREVSCR
jgi:excisionase family DNA binding protein